MIFITRMDAICGLGPTDSNLVRYFAYGSNLDQEQMRSRTGSANLVDVARLDGYRVVFNKSGADGSGQANVHSSSTTGDVVHGCLYELTNADFERLKEFEKGYVSVLVEVELNGQKLRTQTFLADGLSLVHGAATREYLSAILRGAEALGLPNDYIESLRQSAR